MPDVLEIRDPLAEIAPQGRAQCLGESEKALVHGPGRRRPASSRATGTRNGEQET
jgi:hypothetical protein